MVGGVLRTALYTNYGLRMAASRPEKGRGIDGEDVG